MKYSQRLAHVISILVFVVAVSPSISATQHGFTFKEYEQFHDVLHPLEHEALTQKDYPRIRSHAKELVRLGNAILELGVPQISRVPEEMEKELKEFRKALSRFDRDAKRGSDSKLHRSYSAVHDSFEKLARLSEEVNAGLPPVVSLKCPEGSVREGDQVTVQAFFPVSAHKFSWSISSGKLIKSDEQDTIVLDTSGLAGITITVTVEVDDGHQHLVSASCMVTVSAR